MAIAAESSLRQGSGVQHRALAAHHCQHSENNLDKSDKVESQPAQPKANRYGITRGAAYFRKGGDR